MLFRKSINIISLTKNPITTISSQHVQITPGVCGGKPHIAGHWIRVQYREYKAGERREFFTAKKDLDEWAVKFALDSTKREI